jgi:hypothetical protein
MKKNKKNDVLVEEFLLPTDQGAAALMMGLQKPGYIFDRMERKSEKVKVYFIKKDAATFENERKREEEKEKALDAIAIQNKISTTIWGFWAGVVMSDMRQLPSMKALEIERRNQGDKLYDMRNGFAERFSEKELDEVNLENLSSVDKRIVKRRLVIDYQLPKELIESIEEDVSKYGQEKKRLIDSSVSAVIEVSKNLWK